MRQCKIDALPDTTYRVICTTITFLRTSLCTHDRLHFVLQRTSMYSESLTLCAHPNVLTLLENTQRRAKMSAYKQASPARGASMHIVIIPTNYFK